MKKDSNMDVQMASLKVSLLDSPDQRRNSPSPLTNSYQKQKHTKTRIQRKSHAQSIKTMSTHKYSNQLRNSSGSQSNQQPKITKRITKKKQSLSASNINYDIWDLTYTMIQSKIRVSISATLFFILVTIRYYTITCLIYVSLNAKTVVWLPVVVISRFFFILVVIKISLKIPQTRTQTVLKTHWNSMKSDVHQYFQILSMRQFGISIIRGIIPPQLSFVYIKSESYKKKYTIFVAINFIFYGIQAVLYYPFFIIYCYFISADNTFALNIYYQNISIIIAGFAQVLIVIFSLYLLFLGRKKKYGKIF